MILSILALVISALALILAGYSTWHNVQRDKRRDARSVSVTCSFAVATPPGYHPPDQRSSALDVIQVRAVSNGPRPIEIRSYVFGTSTGKAAFIRPMPRISDQVPKRLGDGESLNLVFDKAALERAVAKEGERLTQVLVTDAQSRDYVAAYPAG